VIDGVQCKKHQAATKKLEIDKAPDILVICIKRFGSSRRLSDKLDNMVNFPIDGLDLEERIGERIVARSLQLHDEDARKYGIETGTEPMMYDLCESPYPPRTNGLMALADAVDNHFGGMGGGHYTAFCRNKEDGQWYNYDDSRVSKANVEAVQVRQSCTLRKITLIDYTSEPGRVPLVLPTTHEAGHWRDLSRQDSCAHPGHLVDVSLTHPVRKRRVLPRLCLLLRMQVPLLCLLSTVQALPRPPHPRATVFLPTPLQRQPCSVQYSVLSLTQTKSPIELVRIN